MLISKIGCIVVIERFGDNFFSGSAFDHPRSVIAVWFEVKALCQCGGYDVWSLVKLGSGLACAFAQPFKNCAALGERCMHGRSSTGLRLFVSTQALRCLPMGAQ